MYTLISSAFYKIIYSQSVLNNCTKMVTKKDDNGNSVGTITVPGGKIEMLLDYLQPHNDVLYPNGNPETYPNGDSRVANGYYLELTTASTTQGTYKYEGGNDQNGNKITRATISRDADNSGAAIIAEVNKTEVKGASECNSFIVADNVTFDGKALARKGNGGAISTVNNVVTIKDCDFKGYEARRGGAIFTAWGGTTIDNCDFSNCLTGDELDKTGGGAIWTTAKVLTVKNCTFDHCACESGISQAGAIFHNIRADNEEVFPNSGLANFPTGFSRNSKTYIERCTFTDCFAIGGSGGTVESDACGVTVVGCSFDGSYSDKKDGNANGGALNLFHNNSKSFVAGTYLNVIGSTFKNCQTQRDGSSGGAICPQNTETVKIWGCEFENCSSGNGGAILTKVGNDNISVDIQASSFTNCTGRVIGGAVNTLAKTVTIGDGSSLTAEQKSQITSSDYGTKKTGAGASKFENCTSPQYGGVYQDRSTSGSSMTVSNTEFKSCSSTNSDAGALFTTALAMSISNSTFTEYTATGSGGAVSHSATSDTLNNVMFSNCDSGISGGGAYLVSTTVSITGGSFEECKAQSSGGGLFGKNNLTIDSCNFTKDRVRDTSGTGGAIHFDGGEFTFKSDSDSTKGVISECYANQGGGIYQQDLVVEPNLFNESTCITGQYINANGGYGSDSPSEYSQPIFVEKGEKYTLSGINSTTDNKVQNKRIHGYTSEGK